ncbi:hypothetical protein [Halomonas stenophila]|uniref:Uncharacterized protein n=1 Tax=Halomonas stenophila TaxID=795312 RepID=A0A7W5ETM5_9GAMM|nr:hypothetical protein [Halomonas stenophila]MBB3231126.1 hypothetical protein [Halomonas stenophila]
MDEKLKDQIASLTLDLKSENVVITTKDMIWKQLTRDCPDIERSFDNLFKTEVDELSEIFGEVSGVILNASIRGDELQKECSVLLLNALNIYIAALQNFRSGHRLSPLVLMRSIVELVSVVIHVKMRPKDLDVFRDGKLKSTKCVTTAKQAIPPIGELYGHLSNTVTHVAELHRNINAITKYTERDEAVNANFGFLRVSIWLTYVTTELVFFDLVSKPRYWVEVEGKGYAFSPGTEIKQWMDKFLEGNLSESAT